jgi:hypothetical protein
MCVIGWKKVVSFLKEQHTMRLVQNDDAETDNYELNVARHAFSCSMRYVHYDSVAFLHENDMPLVDVYS